VALEKALPGHPGVYFVDSSADESKLLLFAASDTDPGMFYMFDKATHQLGQVLPVRPELQGVAMGEMKPITYTATDGTKIPAYLTLPPGSSGKNLPAIVMPHGGPSARDEWGFDWLVQYFATRGYAVIQPNYRGSAGYGADFYQHNGFRSWRTAIGDVNDAGRWLVAQGIAAPSKLAIFGWSYGGYAALQTSVLDPALYKAIVAVAPVTDLQHLGEESRDYANHKLVLQEIGEGPQVVEGSPARNAGRIIAPVLMFHGDKDQNVDVEESKFMAEKLRDAGKQVDLVIFPGLDHQLPSAEARTRLLSQSDAFLRKALRL
jgi:dipeptidyl aminopeptidase/acylaminoacyl peptidase